MADTVYSGIFLQNQISDLELTDYSILENIQNYKHVRLNKFLLKENNIIFCNTDDVESLFVLLQNSRFKNIQLITHQSDKSISKNIYRKKPSCISKWYSINIDTVNNDLISIPIGLANYHPKNINISNFDNQIITEDTYFDISDKESKLYLNFQISTNYKERTNLYKTLKNKDWVRACKPSNDINSYSDNLKKFEFVLCPSGNGYDTHRFWETLYSGSIPVLKQSKSYKYADNLPKIFIDDYKNLTKEYLKKSSQELRKQNFNLAKLTFDYWKNLILDFEQTENDNFESYSENRRVKFIEYKNLKIKKIKSKLKIIRYLFWKIKIKQSQIFSNL